MKFQDVQNTFSEKITALETIANSSDDVVKATAANVYADELRDLLYILEMDEDENDICIVSISQLVAEENDFSIEEDGFFYKLAYVSDAHKFNVYLAEL